MKEESADCYDPILSGKWKSWCRLCAKADGQYIDVIVDQNLVFDSSKYIANAILEFLRIHIKEDDKLPQIICVECNEIVLSLIEFSERANRVQQMYDDIQNSINKTTINLPMLFESYGLNFYRDESLMPQSSIELAAEEIFVTDFKGTTISVQTKNEIEKGDQVEVISKEKRIEFDDPFDDEEKDLDHESFSTENSFDYEEKNIFSPENSYNVDSCMDISLSKLKHKAKNKSNAKTKARSPNNTEDLQKYSCNICAENFRRSSNYTVHMQKKHGEFNCRHCALTFNAVSDFKQHMKQQHGQIWNCPHCEQTFDKEDLSSHSNHLKVEHNINQIPKIRNRGWVCDVCGATFFQNKLREQHIRSQHPGHEPNVCKICGKFFKGRPCLKKHLEKHGEKFICAECGIQLSCRAALNSHKLVHSDLKRYKCDVCGRAFKRHKGLKYHLIAHTGLKPYKCDFCEKTFSNGPSCRKHKKSMHPNELAELEASGAVQFTKDIPKLAELRAVARTGTNIRPLQYKHNGYPPKQLK
ncbi:zinc finger protein weckle-like [Eurosta solidaginis]|uniref:zinc finger protein weckle-like n=1 Tax=Eurosta solidaginis TaxID=178769 RepID=UPI0035315652